MLDYHARLIGNRRSRHRSAVSRGGVRQDVCAQLHGRPRQNDTSDPRSRCRKPASRPPAVLSDVRRCAGRVTDQGHRSASSQPASSTQTWLAAVSPQYRCAHRTSTRCGNAASIDARTDRVGVRRCTLPPTPPPQPSAMRHRDPQHRRAPPFACWRSDDCRTTSQSTRTRVEDL